MPGTIPVIDIAPAIAGKVHDDVVRQIRDALEEVGFLQVVGHGVELSLLDRTYAAKDELIGLPDEAKASLVSTTHPYRGWRRNCSADGMTTSERFQVCNFDDARTAAAAGVDEQWLDYFHPNVWPTIPEFQTSVRACFNATRKLGASIMSLFAESLDLGPDFFAPVLERDVTCFAMNVYPGELTSPGSADPRVVLPTHGDSGTLTILHQRGDYQGLQVQQRSGDWLTVPILKDAFVINVGELMAHWTNDRWLATRHRVVAPEHAGQKRTSLTTFYLPSIDTVIAPLSTCIGASGPQYEPVTPYAWEGQYLSRQYDKVGANYVRRAA